MGGRGAARPRNCLRVGGTHHSGHVPALPAADPRRLCIPCRSGGGIEWWCRSGVIQGVLGVRLGELTGSQRFARLARNPPNAAWLCRSLRAGTTTCDSSQWAERDSNPLLFPEGFETKGESGAESGTRGRRCRRRGGRARGHGAQGRRDGRRGVGAAEGTRGNVGAFRADGAGPAGRRPGRPRVRPDANACSWPDGGAGGDDRVCFRRASPVSPVPKPEFDTRVHRNHKAPG